VNTDPRTVPEALFLIQELRARVAELEQEVEDLTNELLEVSERD
jgi:hypothetical protein